MCMFKASACVCVCVCVFSFLSKKCVLCRAFQSPSKDAGGRDKWKSCVSGGERSRSERGSREEQLVCLEVTLDREWECWEHVTGFLNLLNLSHLLSTTQMWTSTQDEWEGVESGYLALLVFLFRTLTVPRAWGLRGACQSNYFYGAGRPSTVSPRCFSFCFPLGAVNRFRTLCAVAARYAQRGV